MVTFNKFTETKKNGTDATETVDFSLITYKDTKILSNFISDQGFYSNFANSIRHRTLSFLRNYLTNCDCKSCDIGRAQACEINPAIIDNINCFLVLQAAYFRA